MGSVNNNAVSLAHDSGSPSASSGWMQVAEAAKYAGDVSPKAIYAWIELGLRVVRLGDGEPRLDSRGRRRSGRLLFCRDWIDEFLRARATCVPLPEREAGTGKSMSLKGAPRQPSAASATPMQRTAESEADDVIDRYDAAYHEREPKTEGAK